MINFPMDPRKYTMDSMPIKFESYREKVAAAIIIINYHKKTTDIIEYEQNRSGPI